MIHLYNQDCMKAMATMKDKEFDLAIVDPPYGIKWDSRKMVITNPFGGTWKKLQRYTKKNNGIHEAPSQKYFDELRRVSKHQIIWGANHFISRIPIDSSGVGLYGIKRMGYNYFADCELAWTSFKTAVRMISFKWHGMLQGDMKNKEHRIHPTQKPVALYTWLLDKYAKTGWKILDTHLGSGSSAIAAHDMGFEFHGYELDEEYFEAASKRLKLHQQQMKLF
jgi:site-specific DNA-methyltransferase (adenine-specific)